MAQSQPTPTDAIIEAAKFTVRIGLLVFVPLLVQHVADFTGFWHSVFTYALPVALPIIDKWVHEDPRVPASGIVPF